MNWKGCGRKCRDLYQAVSGNFVEEMSKTFKKFNQGSQSLGEI
jgi:hypothetical protein